MKNKITPDISQWEVLAALMEQKSPGSLAFFSRTEISNQIKEIEAIQNRQVSNQHLSLPFYAQSKIKNIWR